MNFTNRQKAFLEFIPISNIRKTVLQIYVLILFLIPITISYYFKSIDPTYQWIKTSIIAIDMLLIIVSIPVLIRPEKVVGIFHLFVGVTALYASSLLFAAFLIEANQKKQIRIVNLVFVIGIYLIAVFAENFLIVNTTFSKYSSQNNKITTLLLMSSSTGMILYNIIENTFRINAMVIITYLLAIALGIPIHSLYRGYIILRYKYTFDK
jgi:hypothetical protein